MRATCSGTHDLEVMDVAADDVLGRPGDVFREPHFEGGVWRYAAAHAGGAEALHEAMLCHLLARARAGDPHQEARIARSAIACETARLWVEAAAQRVEAGPAETAAAREGAAAYALLAREAVEEACLSVIATADRAMGMAAFDAGTPAERIRRDLSLFLRQAAPDAKRARAARALAATGGTGESL
jgi:alkylation response protein AidB-like acyl-CoA dehydrogenase